MRAARWLCGLLVGAGFAMAGLPALATGPAIPANPTVADKKAFLAAVLDYIEEHKLAPSLKEDKIPPACNEVVNEVRHGNVTFLEPEAFDAERKPQAVLDIEKRCPELNLGVDFLEDGVTRYTATRNFELYRLPLGPPAATPMYYAERFCPEHGECNKTGRYELIDPDGCATATIPTLGQNPNNLSALVRIGSDYFELSLNDSGQYGHILIIHIPSRRPFPAGTEWFRCNIWPEKAR